MKETFPLDSGPMDTILNDEGDVVPNGDVVINRNNWQNNRDALALDHPGFDQKEDDTVYCGDCGQPLPCRHASGGKTHGF